MIRPQSLLGKNSARTKSSGQFPQRLAAKTSLELDAGPMKADRVVVTDVMDGLWGHVDGEGQFKLVGKRQRNLAPIAVEVAHFFPQAVDDEYRWPSVVMTRLCLSWRDADRQHANGLVLIE